MDNYFHQERNDAAEFGDVLLEYKCLFVSILKTLMLSVTTDKQMG
jgi:hypothetical protein